MGAGFAGLAAARDLHAAGQSVVVLEARDRIGGRAWTSHAWADAPLDMGASWIHGITGNPLHRLADTVGARQIVTRYENAITYGTDGRQISDERDQYIRDLEKRVKRAIAGARRQGGDMSVERAVLNGIDADAMTAGQRAALQFHLASAYEHEYSGDISELSARCFDEDDDYEGDDVLLPNGFGELATFLARGLDIRTGQRVTRVSWNPRGVSVATDRGIVEADRVVITLPLGVLQRGGVEFSPALPAAKTRAIQALGMGTLN